MESNTITPLDLQSEYYRILAALRIAATVAILFAA